MTDRHNHESSTDAANHLLSYVFEGEPDTPLFIDPRGHLVRKYTRSEIADMASLFARGLMATEFRKGRHIAMIARTSFPAFIASIGIMLNGCNALMIPMDATPEEQCNMLAKGRAEALIVEDIKTAKAVLSQIQFLPQLRQLIVLNDQDFEKQPELLCMTFDDLMARGEKKADKRAELLAAIEPAETAMSFFTSKTTSFDALEMLPLSHQDIMRSLAAVKQSAAFTKAFAKGNAARNKMLSVIPFHRPFSHIAGLLLPLSLGCPFMAVNHTDSWKSGNFPMRPNFLIAESAYFQQIATEMAEQSSAASAWRRWAWKQSRNWIRRYYDHRDEQARLPLVARLQRVLFAHPLRQQLAELLGGNIRFAMSIDSELPYEASSLFAALGLPVSLNQWQANDIAAHDEAAHSEVEAAEKVAA